MGSVWTYALISIALVALALSWRIERAWLWIGLGGASFFASTLFYDYAGYHGLHPVITLVCDAGIVIVVHRWRQEEWEVGVAIAFFVSVFCSLLMMGGFIKEQWVYASLLELANLGALLVIGTTGLVDMIGKNEHSALHPVYLHLHMPRSTHR